MVNKFKSIFKKKDNEIELLDDESKIERMIRHLKKNFRRCSKLKLTGFILSFLIIFLFVISLFTGKNIVLVGVKKVLNEVGIYTEEISNVDITSNNYDEEGSWKINKSAKWTSSNTAEVVFDVNSIRKVNDNKKDIILVLDISDSMEGDKINKVISDTKELIDYVLSDGDNRIALITFDSMSTIVSNFTNDKEALIEKLNTIEVKGATNYNAGLKNVNTLMDGYVKESGRDIVTLFLTDGYPNTETPNQVGAYEVLKDKYPYMNVNGVQYEMGKDLIDEIKEISDEQWSANQSTLNNVLFEASVSPLKYEEYIVTDYISDEFIVNSVDDIEVSVGKVELTEENGLQKIIWNLGNSRYATGSKEKMTIKLTLKEEQKEEVLLPTNKKESITYKLDDESETTVNSNETPVLKNMYEVKYDTNAPDGCKLDSIDSEKHGIYTTVKKKTDELSCDGYLFKGWEIDEEDSKDITSVGNDYFIMPVHDVTMRATWTKQSITKTMDGKVHEKTTLYKVFENEAKTGTYAKEYNGDHQDSMDKTKSTKNIYYWYANDDTNANAILDKNNVIFADHCWQMIRTTDTGGVKMVYNGEAENGKCLTIRETHVGYSNSTTRTLNTSYYYGTSYTYDSTSKSFSLSGTVTTGSINIGQYTCLNNSQDGTCTTLYYVDSLSTGTTYNVLSLNTNSSYSQFGELPFNRKSTSLADVGYMYNMRYEYKSPSRQTEYTSDYTFISTSYWYADSVTYSNGQYSLDNPYKVSSDSEYANLAGKYTFRKSDETYTNSKVYYIGSTNGSMMYYKELCCGATSQNDTYTYGTRYTDNGDGTYTINNPTTISWMDFYAKHSIIEEKYVCKNASDNTCSDLWYITYSYNSEWSFKYARIKDKYMIGNSFIYENGKYKLSDTKDSNDAEVMYDTTKLKNYHYTCFNETGECTTLFYIYSISYGEKYYIELNNGKSIDDAMNEMLHMNTMNSTIKTGVDAWFENTLINYSDYLEDTIFCNDRSISSLNGWNPNGGYVTLKLRYKNYEVITDLSCTYETDKFSTENENAKLKYKVGLMSPPEMHLLSSNTLRKVSQSYWLLSPNSFADTSSIGYTMLSNGRLGTIYMSNSYGVRPAISLIPGIEYSSGDGSMDNPYVIDTE